MAAIQCVIFAIYFFFYPPPLSFSRGHPCGPLFLRLHVIEVLIFIRLRGIEGSIRTILHDTWQVKQCILMFESGWYQHEADAKIFDVGREVHYEG